MLKLRRDILLIFLAVVLSSFGTIVPAIFSIESWTPILIVGYFVIIAALIYAIVKVVRSLTAIDKTEEENQKVRMQQLVKDTVAEVLSQKGNELDREKEETTKH